jgi:hypothetical protein
VEWATSANLSTFRGMVHFTAHGLRDWAKLFLAFGGMWLAAPVLYRRQPRLIRRALWIVPLYVVVLFPVSILDEMRVHAELVPLLAAPPLLFLGRRVHVREGTLEGTDAHGKAGMEVGDGATPQN